MLDGSAGGWCDFHKRFAVLTLPQVPDARVAARYAELIAGHDERVLLLGITLALADIGQDLTATDWSSDQIARMWPGDRPDRRALLADWRDLEVPKGQFTSVIGDGSLSTLQWPSGYSSVFARAAEALAPGGRLVIRCFVAPDERESLEQVADDVFSGREDSYHATKWRVAMAAAGDDGNVPVRDIYDAFRRLFPDWPALARDRNWDIEAIERVIGSFRNSPMIYSFVTRHSILATIPETFTNPRFVCSGEYPLAERCPFLVAERAH